jgi:uncharacterized membrane protein YuzA (DUF378 family)
VFYALVNIAGLYTSSVGQLAFSEREKTSQPVHDKKQE